MPQVTDEQVKTMIADLARMLVGSDGVSAELVGHYEKDIRSHNTEALLLLGGTCVRYTTNSARGAATAATLGEYSRDCRSHDLGCVTVSFPKLGA